MGFLGERPLTRRRYPAQTVNTSGEVVRGTPTDTSFQGSYQEPADQRQATRRGMESYERAVVVCATGTLRAPDQATAVEGDEVIVDGRTLFVTRIRRSGGLIPHQLVYLSERGA